METWMTVLTIFIVVFFVAVIAIFYYRDKKNKGFSKYITGLIFQKYNKKIDKISKEVGNSEFSKLLGESKLEIVESENFNENLIFENIKTIDALEDNFELLKELNVKHIVESQSLVNLLKKHLKLYDLSSFSAQSKSAKREAIFAFEEKLRRVALGENEKKVLSSTPCFKFDYVYMFLNRCALKIDTENIFAVEVVDYKDIGIIVKLFDEGFIDFDGTYDLNDTKHEFPKGEEESLDVKEKVWQKRYVLSFTHKGMTYDVIKEVALLSEQKEFDKLTTRRF